MSLVWPLWVRLIHWGVAVGCILNFQILEEGDAPHRWVGYGVAALVLLRLIPGQRSRRTELHPSQMLKDSKRAPTELAHLIQGQPLSLTRGHSPLASPVMIGIWALVLLLGLTGWILGWDAFFGSEALEEIHEALSHALQILVLLHLLGIAHESWSHKTPAWMGMISGKKKT